MNPTSVATFATDGGAKLIGSDVLACHPEPSRTQLASMYQARQPNHYTIRKNGQRRSSIRCTFQRGRLSRLCGDFNSDPGSASTFRPRLIEATSPQESTREAASDLGATRISPRGWIDINLMAHRAPFTDHEET